MPIITAALQAGRKPVQAGTAPRSRSMPLMAMLGSMSCSCLSGFNLEEVDFSWSALPEHKQKHELNRMPLKTPRSGPFPVPFFPGSLDLPNPPTFRRPAFDRAKGACASPGLHRARRARCAPPPWCCRPPASSANRSPTRRRGAPRNSEPSRWAQIGRF